MPKFTAPRGAPDALPPRSEAQEAIVRAAEDLFKRYGYRRIDTPSFEETEVFLRGLEEGSDIVVKKEMYTFTDRGGRSITLRPDGTAPVVRAIIEHGLHRKALPVKLYYVAHMFRYERPQATRYRQHLQLGVEAVGSEGPEVDAEVVELAMSLYGILGLDRVTLVLNSVGHPGCRADYLPKLVTYLQAHAAELDDDCRQRIATNPLRTFDCKVERDREILSKAPLMRDHLCEECRKHFESLLAYLGDMGISFEMDPMLVRGLDYYTRTTFELRAPGLGAHDSVGGGGRYDGLSELLGGERLPGIGFGLGVERIAAALEKQREFSLVPLDAFIVTVGDDARPRAILLATELRRNGLAVDLDFVARGVKGQFKAADRSGAKKAVVIGERELRENVYTVRDMESGEELSVEASKLTEHLKAEAGA